MSKKYTREQMDTSNQFSLSLGFTIMVLLLGGFELMGILLPSLWKLALGLCLIVVSYLYYRLYQKTKEPIE